MQPTTFRYPQGELNLAIAKSFDGRPFTVRLVAVGERRGRDGLAVNDREPIVEFYDRSILGFDHYTGPLGQFVADYYLGSIGRDPERGLRLRLDTPEWNVTGPSLASALQLLAIQRENAVARGPK